MLKKQCLTINVEGKYMKSSISKVKNILWDQFETNAEIEDDSFSSDEDRELSFFFIATDEQYKKLVAIIESNFSLIFDIKKV